MTQQTNLPAQRMDTLRNLLERSHAQIAYALPRHLSPDHMIRMAVTVVQRTPGLLDCTPLSVVGCVMQAAELGLELSGPLGQAWMVPRWSNKRKCTEASFQIGYRGYIALAYRSKEVGYFNAHEVCANDAFDYEYGSNQRLVHKPARRDRGAVTDYYAVFKLKDGASDFEVMSAEDMLAHRDKYCPRPRQGEWLWEKNPVEMGKKTVIRRLAKRAPISIELMGAAELDETEPSGLMEAKGRAVIGGPGPSLESYQHDESPTEEMVMPDGEVVEETPPSPVSQQPVLTTPADTPTGESAGTGASTPAPTEGGGQADLLSDLGDLVEQCSVQKEFKHAKECLDKQRKAIGDQEYYRLKGRLDARWKQPAPQEAK